MMDELKQYTDCNLEIAPWQAWIVSEAKAQVEKWGIQTHSAFEWVTYTTEELGELAKAISECLYRGGSPFDVIKEAVQTATLALKIAEMFWIQEQEGR